MEQRDYSKATTSELICSPFLDSYITPMEREAMTTELRRRGLGRTSVFVLGVLAGAGLWWNVFAWEWAHLDLWDVIFGYSINVALVALLAGVVAGVRFLNGDSTYWPGLVVVVSLLASAGLLVTAIIGWKRRR
jgi:hypothetical protein